MSVEMPSGGRWSSGASDLGRCSPPPTRVGNRLGRGPIGGVRRVLERIRGPHSTRSDAAIALDLLSVVVFALLAVGVAARWLASGPAVIALGLLALPFGVALADFLTGVVHWFADTFFDEETPVLGPALIYAFRDHHEDPGGMARRGFFEVSGNNALACCLPLVVVLGSGAAVTLVVGVLQAFVLWCALAMFATNQFHKWAHSRSVPAWVRWLQRRGWLLSARAHAIHHARDHARAYCVTVGWLNPWLDRIEFFPRVEAGVRKFQRRLSR